ncbi:tetraacyldisaccharide 4'-kinase [Parathalassolituus penaei]|uniref:Tetraacyldisaccharide 4'-kinase n=1 Tax=Parathalassolituus penaei TaxID=2997323 RepID=A0A9X3EF35_9GAMM|nr:tetraacyldisaccharide 4'-kinase [Parathalassolituus penaei]MCY0966423.1 tetraacyldisaccharide 4'-kinase [Parathalassolituus penaei]
MQDAKQGFWKRVAARIEHNWYSPSAFGNLWLLPLHALFWMIASARRVWFTLRPPVDVKLPVIVIGNIAVGGTGKTPLITWLARRGGELGIRVGIVSRGYGSSGGQYPLRVQANTDAAFCGDEPKLLANRLGCPVVVDPDRRRAVESLANEVDLVLSDDGMQHYRMPRVAEVVVVDHERGFGNGWLMPVGPLREPVERIESVDLVVRNGEDFILQPSSLINAASGLEVDFMRLEGRTVHAVAGIGNPQRFFATLRKLGMNPIEHVFADHHPYQPEDLQFGDKHPVVMTEKDWVKCREFVTENSWYLPVEAVLTRKTRQALEALLLTWGGKD